MARLIPSKVFLNDPIDVWGKEKTVGLAEHSVRKEAPPITSFVDGDNLIYWDGFESSVAKHTLYQSLGGTVNRSIDYTCSESFSLKCTPTGGAGAQAGATYYLTDFHKTKLSAKAAITSPDAAGWFFYISISYYDGTSKHEGILRYSADGSADYLTSAGAWGSLISISRYDNVRNWGSMSVAVDLATQKYTTARIYRDEIDRSSYAMYTTANAANPHVEIELYFEDIAGTSIVGYLDDFIVMESP